MAATALAEALEPVQALAQVLDLGLNRPRAQLCTALTGSCYSAGLHQQYGRSPQRFRRVAQLMVLPVRLTAHPVWPACAVLADLGSTAKSVGVTVNGHRELSSCALRC